MKRFGLTVLALLAALAAHGQGSKPYRFVYDVDFQYFLSNNEYDSGKEKYDSSQTFNSARLTPTIGLRVDQNRHLRHSVWLGIDIMKNMGEHPTGSDDDGLENSDLFRELVFWYNFEGDLKFGTIRGWFGIFPKKYSVYGARRPQFDGEFPLNEAELVPTFFTSRSNAFYDNNMEGFLMSLTMRNGYFEGGLDWTGKYGSNRRESFRVFTYGSQSIGSTGIRLGWTQQYFHYANSYEVKGVVDNHLINPFAGWFKDDGDWNFGFRLGYVLGINRDRVRETGFEHSHGAILTSNVRWKGFGILNDSYYGQSMLPYYDMTDQGGFRYADDLYTGSPFYRLDGVDGSWRHGGFYDCLEGYWQRTIGGFVAVRAGVVFHFSDEGYQGWQEQLSLIFSLDRGMSKRRHSRRFPNIKMKSL